MRKRYFHLIFFAILAAAVQVTPAQVPGMFPWWEGPIAQNLGLSAEQNKQIRTTVREWRIRIIKLTEAVEDAEDELAAQMNAAQVDERKAGEAIDKVVAARGELMRTVSQMSLKLRLILTTSQWQELQKRQPKPPAGPPMHRPGMGGPPPAPGPAPPPRPPERSEF